MIILLLNMIFYINGICVVKKKYFPSKYEKLWRNRIFFKTDNTKEWKYGCKMLQHSKLLISQCIDFSNRRQTGDNPDPTYLIKSGVLSYFHIQEICNDVVLQEKNIPIEPLIGFLRHPFYHCFESLKTNDTQVLGEDKH